MMRALAKGAMLTAFGRVPGGTRLYRTATREWMGSQATHVDKLARVWPGYAEVWRPLLDLDQADVWIHEGGWTPFAFFANHLVTGKAGVVTNRWGRMQDRYLVRAVVGALDCDLGSSDQRRHSVDGLRWSTTVGEAIDAIGAALHEEVDPGRIPIDSESIDLCHSGGTLEHHHPDELAALLGEAMRILRPGGIMSHVFDHRDHLHHADADWPFLAHLAWPDLAYRALCGHPLLYHNRLLPGEVAGMFESAGFERVAIRRMTIPGGRYVDGAPLDGEPGVERSGLARRFRAATDDDLRTAAAHYLFRKPR